MDDKWLNTYHVHGQRGGRKYIFSVQNLSKFILQLGQKGMLFFNPFKVLFLCKWCNEVILKNWKICPY